MKEFKNEVALITGGASGIGKIMGEILLKEGAELIICDKNKSKLDETINEFSHLGKVYGYLVDLNDMNNLLKTLKIIKEKHKEIDLLINNAGIVVGKYFYEHSISDINNTMGVNAIAPMIITLEFLQDMMKRNTGHICNIASSAGLISNPKMSVYCASKWSVIGWSDSLRIEMQKLKLNIKVTTVTPYYINTGMFDGVKSIIPILKPETVAKKIIRGIKKDKIFVSMPWGVWFVRLSQGILPIPVFDWFVGKVLGIYRTMDEFKGHKSNKE